MKKNITKKNNWHCPEITRIALNPEQAVLSCCDSITRVQFMAMWDEQCMRESASLQCGENWSA
ncbi:MAG: hypothetical protein PHZ27_05010, partial [Candidatus Omnitrophica bacterium]|nr:hypothetical protein [Candidatus Omnitrophota bacterium]